MAARSKKDVVGIIDPTPTEDLTFTVSLPVISHETPEDEAAVAIDEVAINPDYLAKDGPATTTITLAAEDVAVTKPARPTHPVLAPLDSGNYNSRARQRGEANSSELNAMLAVDDLVKKSRRRRPAPRGFWQRLLYGVSFRAINLGDAYRVRHQKEINVRIGKHLEGGTRFVAVLTRKGGVGKTTVSTLLGMAMADAREDRVVAIDANPDRGTLAERVYRQTEATVRDVVKQAPSIQAFSEFQTLISRDTTRLDVLGSDPDPHLVEPFDENSYNVVADIAERFYSIAITDCGTGMVYSVMRAILQRADSIVVVSGGSVDEARLASETLTWLESNGYDHLVSNAVVAMNTATHGTNLINLEEIEAHFQSRARATVRIPYDPSLATGSVIQYSELAPITREAARELAAQVLDGLAAEKRAD